MAVTVETRTKIIELIVGMVDAAPGAAILSELVEIVDGGVNISQLAIALADNPAFKILYPDSLSNQEFSTNFISLLYGTEIGSSSITAAIEAMTENLDSGTHRGAAMQEVIEALAATSEEDILLGNAAKALSNKTQVANHYSVIKTQSGETLDELKAVVSGVTSSTFSLESAIEQIDENADKGQTIKLTLATDTVSGTTLNDTFTATINSEIPSGNTFVAADVIDGKSGLDNLSITASGSVSNGFPLAKLTSIEIFTINDIGTVNAGVYDFSQFPNEKRIVNNGSTNPAGVTFSKLGSDSSLTILPAGNLALAPVSFTMENATDSVALVFSGLDNLSSITRAQSGKASIVINSIGASNTIGVLDLDTNASIEKLTINATTDFSATLSNDFDSNAQIFISGSASKVDLDSSELSKNIGLVDASGLTSGAVYVHVNQADATSDTKFLGGAGKDVLNLGKVVYSNKDITLVGGAGEDTLILNAGSALTSDSAKNISGFEILSLIDNDDDSADTFNVGLLPEIEKIVISTRGVNDKITLTDIYPEQARNITITGNQSTETMTFTLLNASEAGRKDILELTFDDGLDSENTIFAKAIESVGTETIIITAVDNVDIAQAFGLSTMTNLQTTGPGDISFTTNGYSFNANSVIDVSAAAGAMTLDASASKTNGFEYIGNANIDHVSDNSVGGSRISTAAGRDVITLKTKITGTSGVVVTAGAEGDTIIANAAEGNAAHETIKLVFITGDSTIDTSSSQGNVVNGFSTALMDTITGLDLTNKAASGSGHEVTFDTAVSATKVMFSSTVPVFGTTTMENAGDFYVFNTGSNGVSFIYQDSDGDKILEHGEFGIRLVGAVNTATTKDEFTIADGNLLLSTLAG